MKRRLSKVVCDNNQFIDPKKWVSATKLRNALVNNHYADIVVESSLRGCGLHKRSLIKKTPDNFLFVQGNLFEKLIVDRIIAKFKKSQIATIESANPYSVADYEKTKELIAAKKPIIFGGVLHNDKDFTFGLPDIIIRRDFLPKLFNHFPKEQACPDGYAIIDIKFTTLQLKNDKFTLKNGLNFAPYKSQIHVYSRALDIITGEQSTHGYILGRGWKNRDEKSFEPFDRPGVVEYTNELCSKTDSAIEWVNYIKSLSVETLAGLTKSPFMTGVLPRPEIYPNIHYTLDPPWIHSVKKSFADAIGEISQIYMCGKKIKESAFAKNVFSWRDNSFLNIVRSHRYFNNIKNIIEINNQTCEIIKNYEKISVPAKSLFLDFEVLADIIHDNSFSSQIIFMIGVGYEKDGEFIYAEFTTNETTPQEESRICSEFIQFLTNENLTDHTLVHWSHAESWQWAKARKRLSHDYKLPLFDLCEEFKKHAVAIRGAYNYALKNVAKAMHSHGLIPISWPDTGPSNGLDAIIMLGALRAPKPPQPSGGCEVQLGVVDELAIPQQSKGCGVQLGAVDELPIPQPSGGCVANIIKPINYVNNKIMNAIKEYNKVDVQVLYEIAKGALKKI